MQLGPVIRHRVDPRDIPPDKAARRLGLPLEQFKCKLVDLLRHGFPSADPTTAMYDLRAIDSWMDDRHDSAHRHGLTSGKPPSNAAEVCGERFRRLDHGH